MLARRWRRALDERMAAIGLSDATWAPLIHLQGAGDGVNQTDLAARAGLDGSSLVRVLDILAERGLVERRADPVDRRAKRIHLTESGRALTADIREALVEAEDVLLADLTDADLAAMLEAFDRIDRRLQGPREQRGAST